MAKAQWEIVTELPLSHTYRLKIFGGWLVKIQYVESVSTTFVPDKYHEWNLENPNYKSHISEVC